MYDQGKYEKAFGLFTVNYQFQFPDLARQVMIYIALNTDFETNDNKDAIQNLVGSNSGFKRNDSEVLTVLREIKLIGQ